MHDQTGLMFSTPKIARCSQNAKSSEISKPLSQMPIRCLSTRCVFCFRALSLALNVRVTLSGCTKRYWRSFHREPQGLVEPPQIAR